MYETFINMILKLKTIGPNDTSVPLCYFNCVKAVVLNKRLEKKWFLGLCYLNYHSPEYFGLYQGDVNDAGTKKKEWTKPTKETEIQ